jgi:SWI/SNF-related matrix-associated actin-dependent regulator of chromatin subfamily A-like protein 1
MLFAELYFVPGTILQAEDRIHRISQRNTCDIRYLITENSLDTHIWKMLHYKIATLDNCLDGRNDRSMVGKKMEWNGLEDN